MIPGSSEDKFAGMCANGPRDVMAHFMCKMCARISAFAGTRPSMIIEHRSHYSSQMRGSSEFDAVIQYSAHGLYEFLVDLGVLAACAVNQSYTEAP
jgi:hypothetical protein